MGLMAARRKDAARLDKDVRHIDELLLKVDEFLFLQKLSRQQKNSLLIIKS